MYKPRNPYIRMLRMFCIFWYAISVIQPAKQVKRMYFERVPIITYQVAKEVLQAMSLTLMYTTAHVIGMCHIMSLILKLTFTW